MPERCFCWFNSYSSPLNRGVSIFSVRECVHMPGIALLSVSMCESAGRRGGGGSVTGRQARGEDKARGRACLFVSSFARHHRKRHFTGAVSSFFPINFIFFFQHIKTKPIRYMIYQWSIALLIIIYCNYCTEGLCALTSDFGSIGSKITGKQM